jgi:predicted extracellular nuclease
MTISFRLILLQIGLICALAPGQKLFGQKNAFRVVCVSFYNLENLFDTLDHPDKRDEDFTPDGVLSWTGAKYEKKLDNMARVIELIGKEYTEDGPAILSLAEIENKAVLEDLVKQSAIASRRYQIEHYESPDFRGIDVALLYNPKYFRVLDSRPVPMKMLNSEGEPLVTREMLYVKGILDGDTTHIMVNHWPSRRGGEAATRPLREGCAAINKKMADSISAEQPGAKILIMGDMNDNPNNTSMHLVLNAKKKDNALGARDFYNPFYHLFSKGFGTLAYQDSWSLFDQIVLSEAYVSEKKKENKYQYYKAGILNMPFMQQKTGRFKGYPYRTFDGETFIEGFSDHFPVYIILLKVL